jgi:colicin import membrane protein
MSFGALLSPGLFAAIYLTGLQAFAQEAEPIVKAARLQQQADDMQARLRDAQESVSDLRQALGKAEANLSATQELATQAQARAKRALAGAQAAVAPPGRQVVDPSARQISGKLVRVTSQQVCVRSPGKPPIALLVTPETDVLLNGYDASASDLPEGVQVRASYQLLPQGPTALRLHATSADPEPSSH